MARSVWPGCVLYGRYLVLRQTPRPDTVNLRYLAISGDMFMLIAMPNWPPFSPAEYARDMPDALLELLPSLHGSCIIVQSAVYDHALLAYMRNSSEFNLKIRMSYLAAVINRVEMSLTKSLVLSLASLFDSAPATVNIRRVLNVAVRDQWLPILEPRHSLRGEDVLRKRDRLIRMQRRIKRAPLKGAIECVTDFPK